MKVIIFLSVVALAFSTEDVLKESTGNICQLPREIGPCKAAIPRYFFNISSGMCEKFIYGGCRGNLNNFNNSEQCEQTCGKCGENQVYTTCGTACPLTCDNYQNPPKFCTRECLIGCVCEKGFVKLNKTCVRPEKCPAKPQSPGNICLLPRETGPCLALFPRYFFNISSGMCEKFIYGGCKGNLNNFNNSEECEQTCGKCGENQVYTTCGTACPLTCDNYQKPPEVCTLQCVIGCVCEKGFVKANKTCVRPEECPVKPQKCGVNEVFTTCGTACPLTCDNYRNTTRLCTQQCIIGCECVKGYIRNFNGSCVRPEECPPPVKKTCLGEAETGLCKAYFPSWYYDVNSGQCKTFIYGGCGGNGNRYSTEEECMKNCGEKCGEHQVFTTCGTTCPLTCDNYQKNTTKLCSHLCITGCECEKGYIKTFNGRCVRPEECPANPPKEKTCLGNADPGLCLAYIPSWYYNVTSEQCEGFIYGGCGGNGNRYSTEEECMKNCEGKAA